MLKFIVLFLLSFSSFSISATWVINPDHSEILFVVPYLKVAELTGRFREFQGEVELDGNLPVSLFVKISSRSRDTGNDVRDGHLKRSEFFGANTYPSISFQSEKITRLQGQKFRAVGKLSIKNITRDHIIDFDLSDVIKDTWEYSNRMARFETAIDRTKFQLNWNKTLSGKDYLLGDVIKVRGVFQLQPMKGKTPKNKHMIPDTTYIRKRERIARGEEAPEASPQLRETVPSSLTTQPVSHPKNSGDAKEQVKGRDFFWWLSFCILGLFGFFGVALSGIYGKNALLSLYAQGYEETGKLGLFSDLIVIALVLIYAYAFWYVGWG